MLYFANPFEPPVSTEQHKSPAEASGSSFICLRFDWLTGAALFSTLLSSFAIYLYHSSGTGVIGDPILLRLANQSVVWIPVYRLAMPLLVLLMPLGCRRSFAVFFLVLGGLCSLNDLVGHYSGQYPVTVFFSNTSIGLLAGLLGCLLAACAQFVIDFFRAPNRVRYVLHAAGWLVGMFFVQAIFWLFSRIT